MLQQLISPGRVKRQGFARLGTFEFLSSVLGNHFGILLNLALFRSPGTLHAFE